MTNEEAIAVLKEKYCGIGSNDLFVFRKAIEALEKQIPKKPELWHNQPCPPDWADDDWGYKCPACGNEDIDYPEHHCSCGQALDWSETE